MIRSSLVASACAAIALSGFSPPQASAIEMQGSNPTAQMGEGMISKVVVVHRGATAVGPRGGVYHRGGTRRLSGRRGLSGRGLSRRWLSRRRLPVRRVCPACPPSPRPSSPPPPFFLPPNPPPPPAAGRGRAGIAGARAARSRRAQPRRAGAGAAVAYAGQPPAPGLCWYYTTRATGRVVGRLLGAGASRRMAIQGWRPGPAAIAHSHPPEAAVSSCAHRDLDCRGRRLDGRHNCLGSRQNHQRLRRSWRQRRRI